MNKPYTILKNIDGVFYDEENNVIKEDKIVNKLQKYDEVIIKPSIESGGGRNVQFIKKEQYNDILNIIKDYKENYVIQEVLKQCEELAGFNQSINTIRIMSFYHNGEVKILSSVLRMGINNNRTDNATTNGISCGITSTGELKAVGYDLSGNKYDKHSNGNAFKGVKIPNYNKIIEIIKKEHKKFGHFRLMSWDFAINKDKEPCLIEINLANQGINILQLNNGPLFGDLTTEVLEEVFGGRKK